MLRGQKHRMVHPSLTNGTVYFAFSKYAKMIRVSHRANHCTGIRPIVRDGVFSLCTIVKLRITASTVHLFHEQCSVCAFHRVLRVGQRQLRR